MRIAHVARRFTPAAWGGTEAVVAALAREQQLAGHEVEVLCTAALDQIGQDRVLGVPVRRFGYSYGRFPLSASARAALDRKGGNPMSLGLLRVLLGTPGLSLVHCHTMQRLAGQVRWVARRRGLPYVVQLHGGQFAVPVAEVREMMAPGRRSLDWGKPFSALLGTRRFLADAALVLVLSREEQERARAALPGVRVELLPNGVSPERVVGGDGTRARMRLGIPAEVAVLLTVARVDPQKNQEVIPDLLAAFPAAHAVLAGPVTVPGYDGVVRERARALGVADRLHLVGAVAPESPELADLYAAADLFVLPSRHEPFGIVVLEAWAAGLAVVASRAGGLVDLIDDGVNGVLAAAGAEPLRAALGPLLASAATRRALGERGRATVEARYTWRAVAARLDGLYREVLEGSRS